jgi:hypothetical protein
MPIASPSVKMFLLGLRRTHRDHTHLEVEVEIHHLWHEQHDCYPSLIGLMFRNESWEALDQCASQLGGVRVVGILLLSLRQ